MAETNPTTNQDEPEENQADLSAEDQVGVAPANNNFGIADLTRPLQKPLTELDSNGQAKTTAGNNQRVNINKASQANSKNLPTDKMAGSPSKLSAVASVGQGVSNFLRNRSSNPSDQKQTPEEIAQQKQDQKKKENRKNAVDTVKNVGSLIASGGTNALAWVKLGLNGFKNFKSNWREITLGCLLPIVIVVIVIAIFILGLLNMMPGSKSGTTFAQTETSLESLSTIRRAAEGEQRNTALMTEIREHGVVEISQELDQLKTEVEKSGILKDNDFAEFKQRVEETRTSLAQLASLQNINDPEDPQAASTIQTVANNIAEIMDLFLGKPSKVGFYNLPDLPYFVRKEPNHSNNRQWGKKELIFTIITTAKEFQDKYPKYKIRITDMQFPEGGPMDSHVSHQCGNDADITVAHIEHPESADGALLIEKKLANGNVVNNVNPNGQPGNGKSFNAQMAKDLAEIFFKNGVSEIGFQYPLKDYNKFEQWAGHKDHMHIRIANKTNQYPSCIQSK